MALWTSDTEYSLNKHFYEWMGINDDDCQDLSTYSETTSSRGPPSDGFVCAIYCVVFCIHSISVTESKSSWYG